MQTIATIVGFTSGFALTGYHEDPSVMIATSLIIDLALAPLTATVAADRGRSGKLWALLGLLFGVWALAAALLVRRRNSIPNEGPELPPTSNAA